jgi:hypothetical protein
MSKKTPIFQLAIPARGKPKPFHPENLSDAGSAKMIALMAPDAHNLLTADANSQNISRWIFRPWSTTSLTFPEFSRVAAPAAIAERQTELISTHILLSSLPSQKPFTGWPKPFLEAMQKLAGEVALRVGDESSPKLFGGATSTSHCHFWLEVVHSTFFDPSKEGTATRWRLQKVPVSSHHWTSFRKFGPKVVGSWQ